MVAVLTEGVLKSMSQSKLKAIVGILMLVAVIAGGGVAISLGQTPNSPQPKKNDPETKQANAKDEDSKAMVKRLQGTWACVSIHVAGKKSEPPAIVQTVLTIKGDKWKSRPIDGKPPQTGTIKLVNLNTNPKEIDLVDDNDIPGLKDRTLKGILMLDGDSLLVSFGVARPHGFFTEPGDGCFSMQFQRFRAK
jgi:uncharacterized protein (TIGR03067 family)